MKITFGGPESDDTLIEAELASGRSIWCWKCVVAYTYEGFEERTSSEACNEWMLRNITRDAQSLFGIHWPMHIFHPQRPVGDVDYPSVCILGLFTSLPMEEPNSLSSAILAWFQETQSPLVAGSVRNQFLSLDWESLAMDYES